VDVDDHGHIFSLVAIAVSVVQRDGHAVWVSDGLSELIGLPAELLVGARVADWFDGMPSASLDDLETVGGRRRWDATLKIGRAGPLSVQVEVQRLPTEELQWAVVLTDVHEREERFARVVRDEMLARLSLDLIDQAVLLVSPTLGIERANPALRKILGYDGPELFRLWNNPTWRVHDADARPVGRLDFAPMRALNTGDVVRDEINWMRHADGRWVRVRLSAYPFAWTDEVVVAMTDITEYTSETAPRPPT
jgi:PAS domain-containing protein